MQVHYLSQCDSTNRWAKENYDQLMPYGAVYTLNQTCGRGRLGRRWENAANQALYYTAVVSMPMVQPETLPQLMSLVAVDALRQQYGAVCQIKWPNDLLLQGKKIAGILCESTADPKNPDVRIWVLGIGINLAQPKQQFDAQNLPHAGSLAMAGYAVDIKRDVPELVTRITTGLAHRLEDFTKEGFAPLRKDYCAACVNLGRHVTWQAGENTATGKCADVDDMGRLVVETDTGTNEIFTGEVSVQGIYGVL